ncbi:MAG: hypothetical protein A3F54_05025 [Candidatus Kerfeldbacteria bacterium RIFCSPHIGHO2_12_FULL_48_17]|uniref:D-glycerate dehydrogenase n=1 Tax=Candidatus Kerfeldbacteria bacterium RIFCSPHIGHO2_12_FULL_48_17 TaxID=1798542 RepID=A0A1G2B4S6_9BACT|nr:MAG: hypothetical protein A3F54_05025 [Candidatus Kerfeldbacteria bacterium RIFCSPHIGHO2_12_FULL_48_17]
MFKQKKKYSVFVTRAIPEAGLQLLRKHANVRVWNQTSPIPGKELYREAARADGLFTLLTEKIDKKFLRANKHLKIVANYAVGFDNIDVPAATALGIPVTNTPGVLNEAVAEHALTLMCAISRRIVEADRYVRSGKYHSWQSMLFLGADFFGKNLGIVGLGRIGISLARRAAQGLGMKILYTDPRPNREFERHYDAEFVKLPELLRRSDFVSLHVPLLPSTRHLISAKQFAMMKPTAYLINTSRGPVVDEKALVRALKKRLIAGAAIDVFEKEPRLAPGLTKLDNIILTPHIASATVTARDNMSLVAAQSILDVFSGHRPKSLVDPAVWRKFLAARPVS